MINYFNIAHCKLDIGSHSRLDIGFERQFLITCVEVGDILGIPYEGRRLLVAPSSMSIKIESLSVLRARLISVEDMEFKKLFIFFSCPTLLAPALKVDDSHD